MSYALSWYFQTGSQEKTRDSNTDDRQLSVVAMASLAPVEQPPSPKPPIRLKPPTLPAPHQVTQKDPRIVAIESKAYSRGWAPWQLWQESRRYDEKGLATMITPQQFIIEITSDWILLGHIGPNGQKVNQRFYNCSFYPLKARGGRYEQ